MTICFFGGWDKTYSRNRVLVQGLKENGQSIKESYVQPSRWNPVLFQEMPLFCIGQFFRSIKLFFINIFLDYDILFVPFPSYYDVPMAWLLSKIKNKPIIFDFFISKYITLILDHKCASPSSLKAELLKTYDRIPNHLADLVISDTKAHINLFKEKISIRQNKMHPLPVGSTAVPIPPSGANKKFTILFYGSFLPLHGIEHILKAAKILENNQDIVFKIIGSGPTMKKNEDLSKKLALKNIALANNLSYKNLLKEIASSDLCLGIFGDTEKSKVVIPNKIFDGLAMGKAIITAKTAATESIGLKHGNNIYYCNIADPKSLAEAIIFLKEHDNERKKIAKNGYNLFQNNFTPKNIGKLFINIINQK